MLASGGLPVPCPDLVMPPSRPKAPAHTASVSHDEGSWHHPRGGDPSSADEVHSCPVFPTGVLPQGKCLRSGRLAGSGRVTLRRLWRRRKRCMTAGDPGAGPAVATGGGQPTRIALAHRTRQLGMNGRPASRPPCTNQFTNHMQKALSPFEKGPLALVAGRDLNPRPLGYEPYDARFPCLLRPGASR
jgi:hypothetical protein